jgi:erythromycin esterase
MDAVTRWIRATAHPLATVDPAAPLDDLAALDPLVSGATVVALAGSTRGAREVTLLQHRLLRALVTRSGFRTLAIEMDPSLGSRLDDHVRTGAGDPRALLADARPMWQTSEMLDVVRWLRSFASAHPDDPVRFVGVDDPSASTLAEIERGLANHLLADQQRTGHRVVYWGGSAHAANGPERTASGPPMSPSTDANAGSILRDRLGRAYLTIGVTFDHGSALYPVPPPPASFADSPFGAAGLGAFLLDLHAPAPPPVRAWLSGPATVRLIGPHYDPSDDAAYHLTGGSLAQWFDAIAHVDTVTDVRALPTAGPPTLRS